MDQRFANEVEFDADNHGEGAQDSGDAQAHQGCQVCLLQEQEGVPAIKL